MSGGGPVCLLGFGSHRLSRRRLVYVRTCCSKFKAMWDVCNGRESGEQKRVCEVMIEPGSTVSCQGFHSETQTC
jgi:hypothetical protein